MKSPGNFLVIDDETTKLLQILSKIHPYGNRTILKVLIKFYIKLCRYAKSRNLDSLVVLEDIIEQYLAKDYKGFELKKIQKLSQMVDDVEGSHVELKSGDDISELKNMIKNLQSSLRRGMIQSSDTDNFSPEEAAKLLKLEAGDGNQKRKDYRELRKQKTVKKIEF